MTYRDLIEICYKTPDEECRFCEYKKECRVLRHKINGEYPVILYKVLHIGFDAEIEVEE